jgi:hypothetical protein
MRGRQEFCAMLVKRGADPTLTDDSGRVAADMTDNAELAAWLRCGLRFHSHATLLLPSKYLACVVFWLGFLDLLVHAPQGSCC